MIRCIALDDEPFALKQLENYFSKVDFLELAAACPSAAEAGKVLGAEKIDAIFCDINLPDLDGMEFIKSLANPPLVVFTTAYSEYALEGFKVNAVDYLLKPFGMEEFRKAALKVKKQYETDHRSEASGQDEDDSIFFKTEYKIVRVEVKRILYIEGMSEYLKIHLDGQKEPVIVLMSIKKIEDRLPANRFLRVHKSFIINLGRISQVSRGQILLDQGSMIPIGDMFKDSLNNYMESRFLTR